MAPSCLESTTSRNCFEARNQGPQPEAWETALSFQEREQALSKGGIIRTLGSCHKDSLSFPFYMVTRERVHRGNNTYKKHMSVKTDFLQNARFLTPSLRLTSFIKHRTIPRDQRTGSPLQGATTNAHSLLLRLSSLFVLLVTECHSLTVSDCILITSQTVAQRELQ